VARRGPSCRLWGATLAKMTCFVKTEQERRTTCFMGTEGVQDKILRIPYFSVHLAYHSHSLSAFQYLKYWITLLANNLTCTTIIANIHKTFLIKKHATKLLGCASSMLPTRTKIHFDPNFTKDKKGGSFTAFWTDSMGQSTTYMETFNYTFFSSMSCHASSSLRELCIPFAWKPSFP